MMRPSERIKLIAGVVAEFFNLTVDDLRSMNRKSHVTKARHIAMYLIRKHMQISTPDIGYFFLRDHSTVVVALQRLEGLNGSWRQLEYLDREVAMLPE